MSFIIAIDGPAGSGKGTLAKELAESMRLINIDTGAMYRCVALQILKQNVNLTDEEKIVEILENITIDLMESDNKKVIILNGENVTQKIRSKEVTEIVSQVSSIKKVRMKLVDMQRHMAIDREIVMEGRDIGTYVFPNADVKIYLDASIEERAKRRYEQNLEKGINIPFEEVLNNIIIRDENDKNKEMGALKIADDAIVIDSTNISIEQVKEKVEEIIRTKRKNDMKEQTDVKQVKKVKKKKKHILRTIVRIILRGILGALTYIVYWPKKVGENNIPKNKPVILCGNHVHPFDSVALILSSKNRIYFIAKKELFSNPFLRMLAWAFEVFPVKRESADTGAMKQSIKILRENKILGIFPEGTRNGMAKGIKIKTGATYLALATGALIVPIGIQGNFKFFRKVKNYRCI